MKSSISLAKSKYVCTLLFSLLIVIFSFSQEQVLKLEKVKNGKVKRTKILNADELLVIRTMQGERLKGRYAIIDEETIVLDGGQKIKLANIRKIRCRNGKLLGGLTLTLIGATTSIFGSFAIAFEDIFSDDPNDNAEIATAAGVVTLTAGIVMLSNYNRKLENSNWRLSVVEK